MKIRDVTLLFLVKKSDGKINHVCLGMKKCGFGMNKWNGVGGKVEIHESIEDAAKRETIEEIGVSVKELKKVAELSMYYNNPMHNQLVHVYLSEKWEGDPQESKEMNPKWFSVKELPYSDMWPDDIFWLPEILRGTLLKATFCFEENDVIRKKEINIVDNL